jgi:hypothetical protein
MRPLLVVLNPTNDIADYAPTSVTLDTARVVHPDIVELTGNGELYCYPCHANRCVHVEHARAFALRALRAALASAR